MSLDEMTQAQTRARAQVWNHAFGYIKTSVVKCAVELQIPDILEKHGAPVSLTQLSSALDCPPDRLHRIMRFLIHHGIFKKIQASNDDVSSLYYAQTPLSHLLTRDNMGPFVLLQGAIQGPSGGITSANLKTAKRPGFLIPEDVGKLDEDPMFGMKVFVDAMASHARLTALAIIDNYSDVMRGIGSLVDVGGSCGTALAVLVKAFPWVRGICFDLPEIVAKASPCDGVEFVGGSMFESVPKADAVMLMWILHNWSDQECVDILKRCKEAVPKDTGKVMIIDAILDEDGSEEEFAAARLSLDMTMMASTFEGKERTYREWANILKEAGFKRHVVRNIKTIESVIEAYP